MPLVTLLDVEKVNQMMNNNHQQQQSTSNFNDLISSSNPQAPPNMAHLLSQANSIHASQVTKTNNLFANALLQQFQTQNMMNNLNNSQNSKLFSNNLILNCIQANLLQSAQAAANSNNINFSEAQKQINYSRYKTELCRQFIENGECKYGDKCQFAHGMPDLKDVNRHPKYKTDYCKTFHSKGFCPYGPRCHFIHELHEKYDPSIQNVSQTKKITSPKSLAKQGNEDTTVIDKQLEEIQAQLTSNLFVSDDSNDNFTVINDSKNQLDGDSEKQNNGVQIGEMNSNSSYSSGSSSPVTVSSSSTTSSSYASSSNSASVSSCTSPVLNRATIRKPNKNISASVFDNTMKNIFDGVVSHDERASALVTPRTRSSTSSTSSACSSSSTSSFEFEDHHNNHNQSQTKQITQHHHTETFSPVKQQQPIRVPFKSLGPIGRPSVAPVMRSLNNQNMFDIGRINNLLMQQNKNASNNTNLGNINKNLINNNQLQSTVNNSTSNKSAIFNKNILADSSQKIINSNNGFFNQLTELNNGYVSGQFYQQSPQSDRQSSWN